MGSRRGCTGGARDRDDDYSGCGPDALYSTHALAQGSCRAGGRSLPLEAVNRPLEEHRLAVSCRSLFRAVDVTAVAGSVVVGRWVEMPCTETIRKRGIASTPSRGVEMCRQSDPCLSKVTRCKAPSGRTRGQAVAASSLSA